MRAAGVPNERSRNNAAFSEAEKRRYADTTNRSLPYRLRSTASFASRKPQCCFAGAARRQLGNLDLFIQVGVFFGPFMAVSQMP